MRRKYLMASALVGVVSIVSAARAAIITNGNLVVMRINGTAGAASPGFLEEYTTGGTLVQSIALPTADGAGGNQTCTLPGNATTNEGYLSLSTNGQYIMLACNDAALGATVATGTHDRVVGRLDMNGALDTTTRFNAGSGWNARSAVMDGNNIWVNGSANNKAIIHTTFGSSTGTVLTNLTGGAHVAKIFDNQLYLSIDPNNNNSQGVFKVGTGLPTTTGISPALYAGSNVNTEIDIWDFWFADANTLYFSDSRALASGGGVQKWTQTAGVWSKQYTMNTDLGGGLFGLTGVVDGNGTRLFGTTTDNKLVSVLDTGAASAFTTLATGSAGNIFRGLVLTVPEPGSLSLLVLGGLLLIRRR